MNSSRKIKILCFGDSNTWGYSPKDQSRYPENIRWTGVLQQKLGAGYQVIEEGLNGRTTVFDYKARFGKSGITYLRPCMDSHCPLDFVVLCVGTNDTKVEFNRSPQEIAEGFEKLIQIVLGKELERPSPGVKLIIMAPALVSDAHLAGYVEMLGSEAKTRELPALYRGLAQKYNGAFIDLSREVSPSLLDGCHLEPESHARIAQILFERIVS